MVSIYMIARAQAMQWFVARLAIMDGEPWLTEMVFPFSEQVTFGSITILSQIAQMALLML